jgi:CDGSH-type Zn-finger protein
MPEPLIARQKPCLETVRAGKKYFWCACGRSAKQPFCDGSHKGTGFVPVEYIAQADREVLFCACKHTRTQPICDGTHNNLSEKYEEAGADAPDLPVVQYEKVAGGALKAKLDNDCYVVRVPLEAMQKRATSPFPGMHFRGACAWLGCFILPGLRPLTISGLLKERQ